MTTSKVVGILGVGVLWIVAAGCGEPFAYVGAGGGGGGTGGATTTTTGLSAGAACVPTDANPCAAGLHCKTTNCMSGTCQPTPTPQGQAYNPVCGCDGVAYWNADLAVEDRISYQSDTCSFALLRKCKPNDGNCDHKKNQFCDREAVEALCTTLPDTAPGACMRLPKDCSGTDRSGGECPEFTSSCTLTCDMIRKEQTFRVTQCQP